MYKCVFISLDFGLLWIVCHIQFSDVLNYRNLGWGLGHIHDIYYCRIEGYIYYRIARTSFYIVFYDKWIAIWFVLITGKMRQLVVVRRICCCSQFMIFLLELLGQAIGCLAGPSSSNRKIMNWEQQQILLPITNCLL